MGGYPGASPVLTAPPPSPSVLAQQSGVSQFANGMAAAGMAQGNSLQEFSSSQFLNETLQKIATDLGSVANVLNQMRPDLMPLVQKMAMLGKELTDQVSSNAQGGQAAGPGSEPMVSSGMAMPVEGSGAMTLG